MTWADVPEQWEDAPNTAATVAVIRVASFAVANDHLYAAAYDSIYERQDGLKPIWKRVFQHPWPSANVKGGTGFRGLTKVIEPQSRAEHLLVAQEGSPFLVLNVDPAAPGAFNVEFESAAFFRRSWGEETGYGCIAYNDMPLIPVSNDPAENVNLIGFEVAFPNRPSDEYANWGHRAHYLTRTADAEYSVHVIRDERLAEPEPVLLSTRTMIASPFAGDAPGTLYAGGFDANQNNIRPVHNTGWIYKGTLGK
jgi:hypothetical protein